MLTYFQMKDNNKLTLKNTILVVTESFFFHSISLLFLWLLRLLFCFLHECSLYLSASFNNTLTLFHPHAYASRLTSHKSHLSLTPHLTPRLTPHAMYLFTYLQLKQIRTLAVHSTNKLQKYQHMNKVTYTYSKMGGCTKKTKTTVNG